jgi:hypothetical protein
MDQDSSPNQIIYDFVEAHKEHTDEQIIAELKSLPALQDEDRPVWDEAKYWMGVAYPYLMLAEISRQRRLMPAICLLLKRASYGDPGEIMRGMMHHDRCFTGYLCPEKSG